MTSTVISKMIPPAMEQIELVFQKELKGPDQAIPKVYKGYISSLGASLIQSGLLPTLAIFSADDSGDEGDRWKLLRILTNMMKQKWPDAYAEIKASDPDKAQETRLLAFAAKYQDDLVRQRQIRRHLSDASVALKLALRTYNLQ